MNFFRNSGLYGKVENDDIDCLLDPDKQVKIQNIGPRPQIPETLPCDDRRRITRRERIPRNPSQEPC